MKIKVLYEDADILVVDKPSGISVHPDGRNKALTISEWFVKNYPKAKNVGEDLGEGEKLIKKPGIVHRLDNETSGVLILAKNQKSFLSLKSQFVNREIKKTYNALVSGFIKDDSGIINKPIGRSPNDFRRRLAGRGARGTMREAVTAYKVLKRLEIDKDKFTYLEIKPKTGRTHQIRVHMKFLNHPVSCDSLYNPKGICPKGFSRLALHAQSIEFKNLKGKIINVESPLPLQFRKMLK